jgi:hypothetical protein
MTTIYKLWVNFIWKTLILICSNMSSINKTINSFFTVRDFVQGIITFLCCKMIYKENIIFV